jgi:hypothetical protein
MRICLAVSPAFDIELTADEIQLLLQLADHHYAESCRELAYPDGLLMAWQRLADKGSGTAQLRLSWRQLLTIVQLGEVHGCLDHNSRYQLQGLLKLANAAVHKARQELAKLKLDKFVFQ